MSAFYSFFSSCPLPSQNCTAALPKLRRRAAELQRQIDKVNKTMSDHKRKIPRLEKRVKKCRKRMEDGRKSQWAEMDAGFLHDGYG